MATKNSLGGTILARGEPILGERSMRKPAIGPTRELGSRSKANITSAALKQKIVSLGQSRDGNFLDLAFALKTLNDLDASEFRVVAKRAGLSVRKAYYLAELGEQLRPYTRYRRPLAQVGWT